MGSPKHYRCDGWPTPGRCTNDAVNHMLGYAFCDKCARAYMPSDASSLRADLAAAHEAHQELVALCTGILECLDQGDQWKKPARLHAAGLLRAALEKAKGSS